MVLQLATAAWTEAQFKDRLKHHFEADTLAKKSITSWFCTKPAIAEASIPRLHCKKWCRESKAAHTYYCLRCLTTYTRRLLWPRPTVSQLQLFLHQLHRSEQSSRWEKGEILSTKNAKPPKTTANETKRGTVCQMMGPSPLLSVTRRNGVDPAATLQQKFAAWDMTLFDCNHERREATVTRTKLVIGKNWHRWDLKATKKALRGEIAVSFVKEKPR